MTNSAGLTEEIPKYKLIHSHTARRTGVTLMYLSGMDVYDIMKITGYPAGVRRRLCPHRRHAVDDIREVLEEVHAAEAAAAGQGVEQSTALRTLVTSEEKGVQSQRPMAFMLNKHNEEIPEGQTERGKRTIAKEKLFFHILGHIRALKGYENFQIYCDTPAEGAVDYWKHPYRHWSFLASEFVK